jgi:ditrans,polycis-polyprenyl diphosphate synthase
MNPSRSSTSQEYKNISIFLINTMQHIGFIMDGNRRFAKKLSTIVSLGHARGGDTLEAVIGYVFESNIAYASFWALSRENILERSEIELSAIYALIREKFPKMVKNFQANQIALEVVGDMWLLPPDIRDILFSAIDTTRTDTPRMTVIFAL